MNSSYFLRTSWKNDMFEWLEQVGLDPADFRWSHEHLQFGTDSYPVWILRHEATDFYFKFFRNKHGAFEFVHSPSSPGRYPSKGDWIHAGDSWASLLSSFKDWLSILIEELVPDRWKQVQQYSPTRIVIDTKALTNAPFSSTEAEKVIRALDGLTSKMIEKFTLQEDQIAIVSEQMEYLKEGAKKHGRIDWINISIGVIVNIAFTLALDPEKTKVLWELVRSCFAAVLQLPAP